jgi:hypothetical protein
MSGFSKTSLAFEAGHWQFDLWKTNRRTLLIAG